MRLPLPRMWDTNRQALPVIVFFASLMATLYYLGMEQSAMTRAVILVLDSFGIGATDDASQFGDVGADTLGHIAESRARAGRPLLIPNLAKLGLLHAARDSSGRFPEGCDSNVA
ncbi:MAG TPA: hypothetical protein VJK00_01055, partial [Steroidobacteraceae bacterium]|nr:hypothetical protein [Steroidobacteraceae bacterium]